MTPETQAPAPAIKSRLAPLAGRNAPLRKRRRAWWPWLVGVLLLVAAVFYWVGERKTEVQASAVMSAFPSAQYAKLTASGYVVAQRRAAVSSKGTGRLIELQVREGSVVKAGELLGRLDDRDVQAALQAARANQGMADAGVAQAVAGQSQAAVELGNAEAELGRQVSLEGQGFVSPQSLDSARRRVDAARAAAASAQATRLSATSGLAFARAQIQVQEVNRANTEIRAPFDAVVLVKNANVGDMITPFSSAAGSQGAVVTVADMSTLEVEADVSESNVGQVRIDMPVEIVLDALPGKRFQGSVSRIVPTVDRAKATVMTKVRFAQLSPDILPEMSARVVFMSQRPSQTDLQPVVAVNPKAVVQRDGKSNVWRIVTTGEGQALTVQPLAVTTGRTLGDALEITSPELKAGDRLVLEPPAQLQPGAAVKVTSP
jgi:RND family efflux transporter MFP subunit